jgi:exosortase/archaeosortase family protein
MALPLLFLLFAVAPPPRLVSEAYWWIQSGSALAATELVRATGTPVLGEGITLTTPREVFGIIESCTALGILFVLSVGSVLAREAIRDAGPRSWLLVVSAPFVAMLLNLARITAIVLHPPLNRLHHLGQWTILLALGALLLALLRRALRPSGRADSPRAAVAPQGEPPARLAPTALALAALLAATSLLSTPAPRAETPMPPVRAIPMQHGEWLATNQSVDSMFIGKVLFRERVSRRYQRGDRIVDLFVGEASPRSDWSSPFSPKMVLPGMGWVPVNDPPQVGGVDLPLPPSQTAWVARDTMRWWVVQWRFGDPGLLRGSLQQLLALDASPFRARRPRRVVRLATPLESRGPEGVAQAKAAIASFADEFAELLFPEEARSPR